MTEPRIVPLKGSIKLNTGALLRGLGVNPFEMLKIACLVLMYNTLNRIKEIRIW